MALVTTVAVKQTAKTYNSATYSCDVSINRKTSYYGLNPEQYPCAVVDHTGAALKYIAWPERNQWKGSWGVVPWHHYQDGTTINGKWGRAQCGFLSNFKYPTFTRTVTIDRGNSRKGTMTIKVGTKSSGSKDFAGVLKEITLETEEIPTSNFSASSITASVDSPDTQGTRYIRLSVEFKNPENYYTAKIYDANGVVLATSSNGATSVSTTVTITEAMFQNNYTYKAVLWGKDGNAYHTIYSPQLYVEPSGAGVWVKNSGTYVTSAMAFRNVNNKEIKEVWVKVNGKIYKTRK